ncbi:MAG TPA: chaperone modulator CbpM [Cellvibrionaceae bacterium]
MNRLSVMQVSFDELCQCASASEQQLLALIEQGTLTPVIGNNREQWQFTATAIVVANKAERLHRDLAVQWEDVPLVLDLLQQIDALTTENASLKQRLNRFLVDD